MYPGLYGLFWLFALYLAIRDSDRPVFRRTRRIILQALCCLYEHLALEADSGSPSIERQNTDDLIRHHRIQVPVPADPKTMGASSRALRWVRAAFRSGRHHPA